MRYKREMVSSFAERAERVRGGGVDATIDNMLKITNDGRKCAIRPAAYQRYAAGRGGQQGKPLV